MTESDFTAISCKPETRKRLQMLKVKNELSSYDEVLNELLDK